MKITRTEIEYSRLEDGDLPLPDDTPEQQYILNYIYAHIIENNDFYSSTNQGWISNSCKKYRREKDFYSIHVLFIEDDHNLIQVPTDDYGAVSIPRKHKKYPAKIFISIDKEVLDRILIELTK